MTISPSPAVVLTLTLQRSPAGHRCSSPHDRARLLPGRAIFAFNSTTVEAGTLLGIHHAAFMPLDGS